MKKQCILSKQEMMQMMDHKEFVDYCRKISKAYSECVQRNHVALMATGKF